MSQKQTVYKNLGFRSVVVHAIDTELGLVRGDAVEVQQAVVVV